MGLNASGRRALDRLGGAVDRHGIIRAQYGGDDKFFAEDQDKHIREQIDALLKEAPAAPKKRAKK